MSALRIKLNEAEFKALVRGGEVTVVDHKGNPVLEMILADIGWPVMEMAIQVAKLGADHYKGITVDKQGKVLKDERTHKS